ncbi:hypothetical protein [Kitasatospora purpeofusca]|uniref:hypothetical protein n=1 Tax=Kitasatospora purpeofusca TaxID=67352 RepID=UPI002A5A6814|nr:hypothetical protein [Kitasatospora purpeofusca]MDY0816085.1 hypothetical protein [Kitasatospora purpeofusca]
MNDSTPPEDGKPTSFTKAKEWCKKHESQLLAAGGIAVGLVVGLLVVRHLGENSDAGTYAVEESTASEPVSAAEPADEQRPSPSPHLRKLRPGQNASEEKKAQYKERTGEDLEPGVTWVDPPKQEPGGEAAA